MYWNGLLETILEKNKMQIDTRLKRLEAAAGAVSLQACLCVVRVRVIWPGNEAADAGPERCAKCGGLRVTVRVTYEGDEK